MSLELGILWTHWATALLRNASANSIESDLRWPLRIYFDNVTLTLHKVTLTSQKPWSVIAANDGYKWRFFFIENT